MKNLILLKLGGSLITDKSKPYTARDDVIRRLAIEIKKSKSSKYQLLISHGSGSFAHTLASQYGTADGAKTEDQIKGLCQVQQVAIEINRIVNRIFLDEGLNVLSFVPSSFTTSDNKDLNSLYIDPIVIALKLGIIPLVFGDIILDKKIGSCIYSGEANLDNLIPPLQSNGFSISKVIQAGTTDGVYDENGTTIPIITPQNFPSLRSALKSSTVADVTGGMLHKIEESLNMAKTGTDVFIINGTHPDNLFSAIVSDDCSKSTLITTK
ncbi:MAG: isopentenyl phosphate kinase [Candidatus Shapirobacteria bacterium]|jgi:isopentenyl phosphate kinase